MGKVLGLIGAAAVALVLALVALVAVLVTTDTPAAAAATVCPGTVNTAPSSGAPVSGAASSAAAVPSSGPATIAAVSGLAGTGVPAGAGAAMPYALPATSGTTGAEEAVNTAGQVASTGGAVTWAKFAALGQPYRDYYITMRWNYAAWNFDGTSTGIDNAQYDWMAAGPRLVLVSDPRTGKSIIAAAIEAGPAPWVGITNGSSNDGSFFGWTNPLRGTPTGWKGIVSGFPPVALAALGATTGYVGQTGDVLTYQWAPDQHAVPGPTGATAVAQACTTPTGGVAAAGGQPVRYNGVNVTLPTGPDVDPAVAGATIVAPTAAVARGLAAGFATVGMPYVYGGGTDGGGPDQGCSRAGGAENSCQGIVGLDCSGLTGYILKSAGFPIPGNSDGQRAAGTNVPRDQGQPGDIIGYSGHVAMYLGVIKGVAYVLEAPEPGKNIHIRTAYWSNYGIPADTDLHRYWS